MKFQPPYTITSKIIHLIAQISEYIGGVMFMKSNVRLFMSQFSSC